MYMMTAVIANIKSSNNIIPETWILLDSQSTVSVFQNKKMLLHVCPSNHCLKIFTNGSTQTSSLVWEINNFGTVWYHPNSLANILSLAEVQKKFHVTMDMAIKAVLCMHKMDRMVMKFMEYCSGLYYFNTVVIDNGNSNNITEYSFVVTVSGNKE